MKDGKVHYTQEGRSLLFRIEINCLLHQSHYFLDKPGIYIYIYIYTYIYINFYKYAQLEGIFWDATQLDCNDLLHSLHALKKGPLELEEEKKSYGIRSSE